MTLKQLVEQVASQRGVCVVGAPEGIPAWLSKANEHPDAVLYFSEMLPERPYYAAGAVFHSLELVEGEIDECCWPGGIVYPYGYIPFAKTTCGHQLCLFVEDGTVRFADRSRLADDLVEIRTPEDDRKEVPLSRDNLRIGMPIVASDLSEFFQGIVDGGLERTLDHLDAYGHFPEGSEPSQ